MVCTRGSIRHKLTSFERSHAATSCAPFDSDRSCCKFDKSLPTQPHAIAIGPARVIISAFAVSKTICWNKPK